jgi:hypothetical protein
MEPPADEWTAAVNRGDYASAWAKSDAVLARRMVRGEECRTWPRHLQYIWKGESLAGKRILVRCYHGLGDTLQFLRFISPLKAIARHVTVWVQPVLLELAASAPGVDQVLPLHDGAPQADYDVDVEVMELPHALRISAVPASVPYLTPARRALLPEAEARMKVGLVWQAGSWDPRRSLPSRLLGRIAAMPHIRLYSLQLGASHASCIPAIDLARQDVGDAAANLLALDLIISVDTMMAHLGGALGRPVWTLLHADCDWRWGTEASHTPWYPTMQLFRQRAAGDWNSVIDAVLRELSRRSAHPGAG